MPLAFAAACSAAAAVRQAGFPTPLWGGTSAALAPQLAQAAEETLRGWQRAAASACDERALQTHLSQLDPAPRALLLSQAGPHVARALTAFRTSPAVVVPSAHHLRVLLLRRLRPRPLVRPASRVRRRNFFLCGCAGQPSADDQPLAGANLTRCLRLAVSRSSGSAGTAWMVSQVRDKETNHAASFSPALAVGPLHKGVLG